LTIITQMVQARLSSFSCSLWFRGTSAVTNSTGEGTPHHGAQMPVAETVHRISRPNSYFNCVRAWPSAEARQEFQSLACGGLLAAEHVQRSRQAACTCEHGDQYVTPVGSCSELADPNLRSSQPPMVRVDSVGYSRLLEDASNVLQTPGGFEALRRPRQAR
jgi:hypothetical protein